MESVGSAGGSEATASVAASAFVSPRVLTPVRRWRRRVRMSLAFAPGREQIRTSQQQILRPLFQTWDFVCAWEIGPHYWRL